MHTSSNTNQNAGAKANKIAESASGEFQNFVADVEDLVKETTTLTGEDLNRAKAKLTARLAEAKDSAIEFGGEVANKVRKGAAATDQYVHDQPWKAIGASAATGAAIGLLVGYALARRH